MVPGSDSLRPPAAATDEAFAETARAPFHSHPPPPPGAVTLPPPPAAATLPPPAPAPAPAPHAAEPPAPEPAPAHRIAPTVRIPIGTVDTGPPVSAPPVTQPDPPTRMVQHTQPMPVVRSPEASVVVADGIPHERDGDKTKARAAAHDPHGRDVTPKEDARRATTDPPSPMTRRDRVRPSPYAEAADADLPDDLHALPRPVSRRLATVVIAAALLTLIVGGLVLAARGNPQKEPDPPLASVVAQPPPSVPAIPSAGAPSAVAPSAGGGTTSVPPCRWPIPPRELPYRPRPPYRRRPPPRHPRPRRRSRRSPRLPPSPPWGRPPGR